MKPTQVYYAFRPEIRDVDLPTGVIGQVAGIALVYEELDSHGSTFLRGALDRTIRERVAAGKVKLFWDHGDSPEHGFYDSDLHIGTVRSIVDVQLEDGRWAAYMVADLIDVPKAHEVKQYLASVLASGGETGLSIGCTGGLVKAIKSTMVRIAGDKVEQITEFPLSEISITSMQAVPDSEVLAVRAGLAAAVADGSVVGEHMIDEPTPEPIPAPAPEPVVRCTASRTVWELLESAIGRLRAYAAGSEPVTTETLTELLRILEDALAARRPDTALVEDNGNLPPPVEEEPQIRASRSSMEAAFDVLLLALPAATVRARIRAVLGDADPEDSNAAAAHPRADSDAEAQDSRTTTEETPPVVYATMEARIQALRTSYAEAP